MFPSTEIPETQKQNIIRAFTTLKTHATTLANFTLQWQDLEDHFLSIHNSIQSKLHNSTTKPHLTILDTPLLTGKELLIFLNSHSEDRHDTRDSLREALRESGSVGRVVIDAVRYFYDLDGLGVDAEEESPMVRKSCVFLLEEFVRAEVGFEDDEVREDARRVAVEWRGKVKCEPDFALEIQALLLLIIGFGLAREYKYEELVGLLESVVLMKCSVELFRGLGLMDKAQDFIQKLIGLNKRLEAIRFIYEFGLADKFPTVPLIREHLNYIEKTTRANYKVVKKSHNAEILAINSEKNALRATCRIIEKYNILYPIDSIRSRAKHLIRQKRKKNAFESSKLPYVPQQKSGKKPNSPAPSAQPNQLCKNKQPQTVLPAEAADSSDMSLSTCQPASLSSLQESQYFTSSARMSSPTPASQYARAGSASRVHSVEQESRYNLPGLFARQSPEHASPHAGLIPLGATSSYYSTQRFQYNQKHSDHDILYPGGGTQHLTVTPAPAHYNLTGSFRDDMNEGLLAGTSRLLSSAHDSRYLSSSLRLYETSSLATESDDRYRLVRNPYSELSPYVHSTGSLQSSMGASPRMRSYYDREI